MFARIRTSFAALLLVGSTGLASGAVQRSARLPQLPQQGSFALERGRAGQFELGKVVDDLYHELGQERLRVVASFRGAEFQPELQIQLPGFSGGPALTAWIREWPCGRFALYAISVHDPRFRTDSGLGVGSTLGELRRLYPAVKVTGIETDDAPHVTISQLGLSFEFGIAPAFPDSARVTSVLVTPRPNEVRARLCPDQPR